MTRTAHRISAEVSLVSALPGLDVAAKEAVLLAVSRSRYPNLEAYGKAKAEVMRCRQIERNVSPSVWARLLNACKGKVVGE